MKHIAACVINDLTYDQRMIRCCSTLAEHGYRVSLIGRSLPWSVPLVEQPFEQHRLQCTNLTGPGFYAEYNRKLRRRLLDLKPDILLSCDLDTALAVNRAANRLKKPMVHDAHEWFTEVPELQGRALVRQVWQWIGKFTVPRFDACYTVGESIADQLHKVYGVPFGVVRNVPELVDEPILSGSKREPVILYQGALNKGRGLEAAIAAMPKIDGYELWLAGEGDLSEDLRVLTSDLGLSQKVRFLGRVEPAELRRLGASCMIGLNLLEATSLNYYHSLANKFFDYMHSGTPSINMAFPEYENLLSRYPVGLSIHQLDASTVAEAINRILNEDGMWATMSVNCREAREDLNWQNESAKLLEIFKQVS